MKKLFFVLIIFVVFTASACTNSVIIGEDIQHTDYSERDFLRSNVIAAKSEQLFICNNMVINDNFLLYFEPLSGMSGVVCGKNECMHQDETCNAYLGNRNEYYDHSCISMCIYKERIYWYECRNDGDYLLSQALDGTEKRVERKLEGQRNSAINGGRNCMTIVDDILIFTGIRTRVEDGKEKEVAFIYGYPLKSNKKKVSYYETEYDPSESYCKLIIQPFEQNLFYLVASKKYSTNEEVAWEVGCFLNSELTESPSENIYEGTFVDMPNEIWCDYGGVFVSAGDSVFKIDNGTARAEKLFSFQINGEPAPLVWLGDDIAYASTVNRNTGEMCFVIKDFTGEELNIINISLSKTERDFSRIIIGADKDYIYSYEMAFTDMGDDIQKSLLCVPIKKDKSIMRIEMSS